MNLGWPKSMFILLGKFLDDEVVQQRLDVLEVGHISRGAKNCMVANSVKALNVLKSRERTVRRWGFVRSDDEENISITHRGYLQPS